VMDMSSGGDPEAVAAMMDDPQGFMLKFLIVMLIFIPLSMSIWFAPALIAINNVPLLASLKMSFVGCLKNILPFLLFGIIGLVFYVIAALPLGLGLLVFFPTFTAGSYVAYREIFTEG